MIDFSAFPPEINSARMFLGAGSGSTLAAATAWDGLAVELGLAAASFAAVTAKAARDSWQGTASAAMLDAAVPYLGWLHAAAARAQQAGAQARLAASAFEAARAATVHPTMVAANRARLVSLVVSNLLGQNAPAIAATEAAYEQMWAQDVAAMFGYHAGAAAVVSVLTPLSEPPQRLLGALANGVDAGPGVANAAAAIGPGVLASGEFGFANTGSDNVGVANTGDGNFGFANTGNRNIGIGLTGDNGVGIGGLNPGSGNVGLFNSGSGNLGFFNSGTGNVGIGNSGLANTGIANSQFSNWGIANCGSYNWGIGNAGSTNTGYFNSAVANTGIANSGSYNTGIGNSGSTNTGSFNPGSYNTGYFNYGDYNTGVANSGDVNTGALISGSFSNGFFWRGEYQGLFGINIGFNVPGIGHVTLLDIPAAPGFLNSTTDPSSGFFNFGAGSASGFGNSGANNSGFQNVSLGSFGTSGARNYGVMISGWVNRGDTISGFFNSGPLP